MYKTAMFIHYVVILIIMNPKLALGCHSLVVVKAKTYVMLQSFH